VAAGAEHNRAARPIERGWRVRRIIEVLDRPLKKRQSRDRTDYAIRIVARGKARFLGALV